MRESRFQAELINDLKDLFPGCVILKNDPNYLQGFPDLLILFNHRWAALEVKAEESSPRRPNQEYYVGLCRDMSYAAFVHADNKEDVLRDLQQTFGTHRAARLSKR